MRAAFAAGAAALLLGCAFWPAVQAQSPGVCKPGPDALGIARTVDIDATRGPRYGNQQYPDNHFLRDGEVVLTFDDGPHPTHTPAVLQALEAHCTRATFFMVGQRALTQPALVRDMALRGHTIATHTWSHRDLRKVDPIAARTEIELGISAVQRSLGTPAAPFFRFPYLSDPGSMQAHLKSRNTGIFSIDVDSYDYKTRSPTMVVQNVLKQLEVKKKGILLFHDIQVSTVGAIKPLLAELKARGYRVVHLRADQGQTTVAEFDKRIDRDYAGRRIASLPVAQRGVVAPGWEANIQSGGPAAVGAPQQLPQQQQPLRPMRRDDDWRNNIFRGW
jgi:peptidoglycan/xylan/chitin deacetylase (PgdA/CDA1 family)